jgi:hypothetical protein
MAAGAAADRQRKRDDNYKWVALANTTAAMFMSALDGSIVIIALPAIFRGIHLDPLSSGNISYLLWMIMGYLLVQSVLVVTLGRLGDMFGRVRIYNLGFVVFTLASIALSLDPMTGGGGALWLIGWRVDATDALVESIAHEGVVNLVAELGALLVLGHDPGGRQGAEDASQVLSEAAAERGQFSELDASPDDRQKLEGGSLWLIKLLHTADNALRQALRQALEPGSRKIRPFLDECSDQPDGEQRVAPGSVRQPIDQLQGRMPLDEFLRQLAKRTPLQRADLEAGQDPILIKFEQHLRGHFVLKELGRAGGDDRAEPGLGKMPREIAKSLPGRSIGEMSIVEDGNDGAVACQGVQYPSQSPQDTQARWLLLRSRPARGSHAVQQRR